MQSNRSDAPARWLGVGVSDRYAARASANAVCGFDPCDAGLAARFWQWTWDPPGAAPEVAPLLDEVRAARCALLDGPQGLARAGRTERACEDAFQTTGRTPDRLPEPGPPLAGKLRSSVELFAAFFAARVRVSPVSLVGGVGEVFPGAFWRGLERFGFDPLPAPGTELGRRTRRALFEALGVRFPTSDLPDTDQLEACLAALTAAAADGAVRGVYARARGDGLFRTEDGFLREGPIVELTLQGFRIEACRAALEALAEPPIPPMEPAPEAVIVAPPPASPSPASPSPASPSPASIPSPARPAAAASSAPVAAPDPDVAARAEQLFDLLLARLQQQRPLVVTYAAAYALLFPEAIRSVRRWTPDLAQQVVAAVAATTRRELPGLGPVALDAFVVDSTFKVPGRGHWKGAAYTVEQWRACFGLPEVAEPGELRLERTRGR